MKPLYWVAITLLGLTSLSSALFYLLHLATNEPVPLARARVLYRWAVVVLLASFNAYIYGMVIDGLRGVR